MPRRTPPSLAVLDAALTWTHAVLQPARVSDAAAPTPCAGWDLRALLVHMEDSLAALGEAAHLGRIELRPPVTHGPTSLLVDQVCRRAHATRAAWGGRVTSAPVTVGDLRLGQDTMALVGALEVTVHGWDVARATGSRVDVPPDLAARLLPVALAVVTPGERGERFGAPRRAGPSATRADRLLSHLGRDPAWAVPSAHRSA